ncbi:hypothetical protein ACLOJK_026002 [Asimina triloba]
MPHLRRVPGVLSTADVFRWLAGNSTSELDLIVQYWQLVAQPNNRQSGDYGYSESDMHRIMQHSGVYPDYAKESADLAAGRPNVKNKTFQLDKLWGSGIVHAKVWISDCRDVYIGSANNDWKSLTQFSIDNGKLKEKCLAGHNLYLLKKDVAYLGKVPDVQAFINIGIGLMFELKHKVIIKNREFLLLFGRFQTDEQGWVDTIKSVQNGGTVRISTMDWLGQSQYAAQTVYWSSLSSAISEDSLVKVVFSKHATVKLIVAYWAHFIENTDQYLKSLLYTNILCSSSKYNKCAGTVEIKYYKVPGFNMTGPAISNGTSTGNAYPGYTRVNHGKYAVSDVRAHIGTSNLIWDYFYTTAGVSFGTYHPAIVSQLQEIFDADWNSPYAVPVEQLHGSFR